MQNHVGVGIKKRAVNVKKIPRQVNMSKQRPMNENLKVGDIFQYIRVKGTGNTLNYLVEKFER